MWLWISRILLSSPSISPESQTPFRVLYFWNNTKVLSPYVWLYCCTIIHFHILISHVLKQQQVRFKFLLSDETSHRNSFWAYSASFTDYVQHINLLSFDNFATQFIHLWNSDKDFNQIVRRVTLNSAEYACVWYVSNIMAKKSYTTIENICISLHDTGLFTCTCTSYRNSYTPLLASKNDATHQNLYYTFVS